MVTGVCQDAASGHLGIKAPTAFLSGQGARPGPSQNEPPPFAPVRSFARRSGAGLRPARAKAKLVPDTDLEPAPPRQADDVGRFLDVCGERLFDEHMATSLKRIHRQPVMREMGRKDRQRLRRLPRNSSR